MENPTNYEQDKVDEELEEMEADEESDVQTNSIQDPFSLRTTPNSIISITDEETLGDPIDLTDDLAAAGDLNDSVMVIERRLREDTYKVLRILGDEPGLPRSFDEIYAYLEAHLNKPNRVQIVVEEFMGMHQAAMSRTPSPVFRQVEPSPDHDEEFGQSFKDKGKGIGKNSNRLFKPVKVEPSTAGAGTISAPVAMKRSNSSPPELGPSSSLDLELASADQETKRIKLQEETEETKPKSTPPVNEEMEKVSSSATAYQQIKIGKRKRPIKNDSLTEDMLHGPFDFSQHRGSTKAKTSQRTQNLPSILHDIVEDSVREPVHKKQPSSTATSNFLLTPPKLSLGSKQQDGEGLRDVAKKQPSATVTSGSFVLTPPKFRPVGNQEADDVPQSAGWQAIKAGEDYLNAVRKLDTPPRQSLVKNSLNATITISDSPVVADTRQRTPSIEVMREEIVVDNRTATAGAGEVVEIPDDPVDAAEVTALADNLIAMFPGTPSSYIKQRCVDLVGKLAAIDRFMEELLTDPNPPQDWERIYKKPFIIIDDTPAAPTAPAVPPIVQAPSNSQPKTGEPQAVAASSNQNLSKETPVAQLKDDLKPSAGPSEDSSSDVKQDLDPVLTWELERHGQMLSMFPDICPDYLMDMVKSVKPTQDQAADTAVINIADLDGVFGAKVESLFAMRTEERSKLPTRVQWETKRKAKAELEKWSGNMSVNDMLVLYSDDPAGHFCNPERKPESDIYKTHAVEGLKHEFRYQSVTEIERAFRKSKFFFAPAHKTLNKAKPTRKTRRPDLEIKFPTDPCIEFLKEKKYVELEEQIKSEKERRSAEREAKIEAAKLLGNLQECLCCYSSDCLPDDMIPCKAGHLYCRDCISRGTSVAIGDGKTVIECLGHCQEEIGWQELQKVVAPNILSKLLQRRQAEEVGAADLDNLVTCPFCPYVTIMDNEHDKVLICRNPDCGRDSCRLCKEPNHVPLRCDEIEKADEETERKRIEEQLSEAMMRECWKCKVKYFKEEGCNKMACPRPGCGAMMCYLCKQPVKDYTHFYGQGGAPDQTRTCPLWTDNKKLHEQEVAQAAAKAKEELKKKNIQLKHDPTAGVALPAGGNPAEGVAPDVADVIAPGVPREILIRQQRQIEDLIRHGGAGGHHRAHGWMPLGPMAAHGPIIAGAHHHGQPWRDGMLEQMEQIMRMREQQRNNMRLIRQREQQALRDFERARQQQHQQANRVLGLPPPPPPAQYHHLPPAPFQVYGNPQAVPEPLPFLEVVENHGRNIHIVQQQRMPFIAGPAAGQHVAGQPAAIPPPPLQHQQVRLPPNIGQQRQQAAPAAGGGQQHRQHHHHRDLTVAQRDRERRSREEAIIRLRRNREEVLRRQRRHGHGHERNGHDRHRLDLERETRVRFHQNGEVRVERVPNTYPDQAQQPEQQERRHRPNRET